MDCQGFSRIFGDVVDFLGTAFAVSSGFDKGGQFFEGGTDRQTMVGKNGFETIEIRTVEFCTF